MGEVIAFDFKTRQIISREWSPDDSPVARARITRVKPPRRPLADMEVRQHPIAELMGRSAMIEKAADIIVASELAFTDSSYYRENELEDLYQQRDEALSPLSEIEQELAWDEANERLLDN